MGEQNVLQESSARGRRAQRKGKIGELAAERALRTMGIEYLRPVGKNVHLTPVNAKKGIYRVRFISRLPGDYRGVVGNGRSVLVEVKHITDRNTLRWSDLRPGQAASLTEHAKAGGLSLLVWVHDDIYVLEWPIDGFKPRKSISLEMARRTQMRPR